MKTQTALTVLLISVAVAVAETKAKSSTESFFNCGTEKCIPLAGLFVLIVSALAISKLFIQYSPGVTRIESTEDATASAAAEAEAESDTAGPVTRRSRSRRSQRSQPAEEPTSPRSVRSARSARSSRSAAGVFKGVRGIGPSTAQKLHDAGIEGIEDLADADAEELAELIAASNPLRSPRPKQLSQWIKEAKAVRAKRD